MANEAWIKRQTESPEARRLYEEERLILWTTEAIWAAMDDRGLTRAEVAERLGTSRANVTQLLSGTRNMTLRSLAALAHACGLRADVHLQRLTDSVFIELEFGTPDVARRPRTLTGSWIASAYDETEEQSLFHTTSRDDNTDDTALDSPSPAHLELVA